MCFLGLNVLGEVQGGQLWTPLLSSSQYVPLMLYTSVYIPQSRCESVFSFVSRRQVVWQVELLYTLSSCVCAAVWELQASLASAVAFL